MGWQLSWWTWAAFVFVGLWVAMICAGYRPVEPATPFMGWPYTGQQIHLALAIAASACIVGEFVNMVRADSKERRK